MVGSQGGDTGGDHEPCHQVDASLKGHLLCREKGEVHQALQEDRLPKGCQTNDLQPVEASHAVPRKDEAQDPGRRSVMVCGGTGKQLEQAEGTRGERRCGGDGTCNNTGGAEGGETPITSPNTAVNSARTHSWVCQQTKEDSRKAEAFGLGDDIQAGWRGRGKDVGPWKFGQDEGGRVCRICQVGISPIQKGRLALSTAEFQNHGALRSCSTLAREGLRLRAALASSAVVSVSPGVLWAWRAAGWRRSQTETRDPQRETTPFLFVSALSGSTRQ